MRLLELPPSSIPQRSWKRSVLHRECAPPKHRLHPSDAHPSGSQSARHHCPPSLVLRRLSRLFLSGSSCSSALSRRHPRLQPQFSAENSRYCSLDHPLTLVRSPTPDAHSLSSPFSCHPPCRRQSPVLGHFPCLPVSNLRLISTLVDSLVSLGLLHLMSLSPSFLWPLSPLAPSLPGLSSHSFSGSGTCPELGSSGSCHHESHSINVLNSCPSPSFTSAQTNPTLVSNSGMLCTSLPLPSCKGFCEGSASLSDPVSHSRQISPCSLQSPHFPLPTPDSLWNHGVLLSHWLCSPDSRQTRARTNHTVPANSFLRLFLRRAFRRTWDPPLEEVYRAGPVLTPNFPRSHCAPILISRRQSPAAALPSWSPVLSPATQRLIDFDVTGRTHGMTSSINSWSYVFISTCKSSKSAYFSALNSVLSLMEVFFSFSKSNLSRRLLVLDVPPFNLTDWMTLRNSGIASSESTSRVSARLHLVRLSLSHHLLSLFSTTLTYAINSFKLKITAACPGHSKSESSLPRRSRILWMSEHFHARLAGRHIMMATWVMQHAWRCPKWSLTRVRIYWRIWGSRDYTEAVEL